jgi:tRNA threonylcarbamoyl adenosine modification protein YeaZ
MPDRAEQGEPGGGGLLAIECSSRHGSVAIRDRFGGIRLEEVPQGGREREPLLPAIDRVLRDAGVPRRGLRAIAVSTGPGGFTGLRVSIAAAKGIAEALDARTVSVPSAAVAAESLRQRDPELLARGAEIAVLLQSKRESAWLERLRLTEGAWVHAAPPGLADGESVLRESAPVGGILLADEHAPGTLVAALRERGAEHRGPPEFSAAACLRIAERALADHAAGRPGGAVRLVDRLALAPLYPREPEAVTLWNQRHPG